MSCGVTRRGGSDLVLPWLWCRSAAVAPILPLAWELPYAAHMALERKEKEKRRNVSRVTLQPQVKFLVEPQKLGTAGSWLPRTAGF